jgi:virulence-associated protein VagC
MAKTVGSPDSTVSTIHTKSTLILNPAHVPQDIFKLVNDAVKSNDLLPPNSPAGIVAAQARSFYSTATGILGKLF